MIHLASLPDGSRVSRADLALAADCPEQFLSKVLQSLTRAGLVASRRGNTGGFELPRIHRTASILEIAEAIEGPMRLNLCLMSERSCTRSEWCPAHAVWLEAQKAMADVLRRTSIADLAQQAAEARHAEREPGTGTPQWN